MAFYFKNTLAFSQREKACSVSGFCSPLYRGTMPALSLQKVFSIESHIFYFTLCYKIEDAFVKWI